MGGSGSGGGLDSFGGGGSGGRGPTIGCEGVAFTAVLEGAGAPIEVGEQAELVLVPQAAGLDVVHAIDLGGDAVGSVVDRLDELLPCMRAGWAYTARVTHVNTADRPVARVRSSSTAAVLAGSFELERVVVGSGSVELVDGDGSGHGVVAVIGDEIIAFAGSSLVVELRSLLRVGVGFECDVSDAGDVTLRLAE